MTPQLWIGLGFTAALVIFLMITYFVKDTSSPGQYNTLRFLTALCAGFAGGFFTGEALFRLDQQMADGARLAISGTAGTALFFTIWFTYGTRKEPPPPDRVRVSIPAGWTFEQAARAIVNGTGGAIDFDGLGTQQLATPLPAAEIDAPSPRVALSNLRYHAAALPPYRVEVEDGVFHLRTEPSGG